MTASRTLVRALEAGRALTFVREHAADLLTPVGALLRWLEADGSAGGQPEAFLFESVEQGERIGRYSYVGLAPRDEDGAQTLPCSRADALMEALRGALTPERVLEGDAPYAPPFLGGAVFALDWELVRVLEPRLGPVRRPLGTLTWFPTVLAFDHLRGRLLLAHTVYPHNPQGRAGADLPPDPAKRLECARTQLDRLEEALAAPFSGLWPRGEQTPVCAAPRTGPMSGFARAAVDDERFCRAIERARRYIAAGDVFQVVLSRRFEREARAPALAVYRALRSVNPSPYMFFLRSGGRELMGASPELLCRVHDGIVTTHPIAGTRRRGGDEAQDRLLAKELLEDAKERAEHAMLLDLARNDIGRVALPGSVRITRRMEVERFSHVMHMVSEVQGRLRAGCDALDALLACFPAGTVSGAPKVRAMEIIDELERSARGPYAGALGVAGPGAHLDACITIRTVERAGSTYRWQAGAGIVYDSVPEREAEETIAKAGAMARALEFAEAASGAQERAERGSS